MSALLIVALIALWLHGIVELLDAPSAHKPSPKPLDMDRFLDQYHWGKYFEGKIDLTGRYIF